MSTVAVTLLQPLLGALSGEGIAAGPLLARSGVSPDELSRVDGRVPYAAFMRLWELATEASADPFLGLHVAERHVGAGTFFVAGFAARQCETLGQATAQIARYARLMNETTEIVLERRDGVGVVTDGPRPGLAPWPRHYAEMALGSFMVLSRRWTGAPIMPVEARFQHGEPGSTSELRRVFGCPLRFNQPRNQLVWPESALEAPLVDPDPQLRAYLDKQATELLASLGTGMSLIERVRRRVGEQLSSGPPSLSQAARALGMSARTLQRQLGQEGHSYAGIVDDTRREVALAALKSPRATVAEAALLTGYQDEKAFRKAFLRWTGTTPGAFRARRASSPPPSMDRAPARRAPLEGAPSHEMA